MLTLPRRVGQRFILKNDIYLQVLSIETDEVVLTVCAPRKIDIFFENKAGFFTEPAKVEVLDLPPNKKDWQAVKFSCDLRQKFLLDNNVWVKFWSVLFREKIWLSFDAPKEVSILREEANVKHDR